MPLNESDREEIRGMLAADREARAVLSHCRADYPHDGKLRYIRGVPPVYVCECGMRYEKDGKGGLRVAA